MKPCQRCDRPKEPGRRGRKLCGECRAVALVERAEKNRARARAWHAENRERHLAYMNARTAENPGGSTPAVRAWRERNPEDARHRQRLANKRRRATIRGARAESVEPLVVLELHDGVCGICGEDVDPFDYEVDHVIPIALGGDHTYENTQPAHRSCNRSKGARLAQEVVV